MEIALSNEEIFKWINKIANEFYDLVYNDTWFGKMFANVEQELITSQQIDFMIQNFGGPKKYCGRSPNDAHPHIWIDENIWNYREQLLNQAFDNLKAPEQIREKWLRIDNAFKKGILNTGGPEECRGRYKTEAVIYYPMPEYLKKKAS